MFFARFVVQNYRYKSCVFSSFGNAKNVIFNAVILRHRKIIMYFFGVKMFVSLEQIKNLIPPVIHTYLSEEDNFDQVEALCADKITELTGHANPAIIEDAPKWAVIPSAWIITYLSRNVLSGASEDFTKSITRDYENALADLKTYANQGEKTEFGAVFEMEGLFR